MGKTVLVMLAVMAVCAVRAEVKIPRSAAEDTDKVMSEKYWSYWNDDVQKKIDADIEANRKADASLKLDGAPEGTEVNVEQISHDFVFGAHIFNFDQLGDTTLNNMYKNQFGTLFNSATVAFYWNKFEMSSGRPRYAGEYWDSQHFWNNCQNPEEQLHWRRPPTDPVIDYLKDRGVRVHGHVLIWGSRFNSIPAWLFDKCLEGAERKKFLSDIMQTPIKFGAKCFPEKYKPLFDELEVSDLDKMFPKFADNLKREFALRIKGIAEYYKDRVDSWDVVNESAPDSVGNNMNVGGKLMKSRRYKLMPADYTYEGFKVAQSVFPRSVKLNINDSPYSCIQAYADQIKNLLKRGCKIDIVGIQMHIFSPASISAIASGKDPMNDSEMAALKKIDPQHVWKMFQTVDTGLPVHMSEITITAPDETLRGGMVQAIIARNVYRLWFSLKPVMGITWWNTVDGCGYAGEPVLSGLFTRSMQPKPAYYALNSLINGEWKTNLKVKVGKDGKVKFRGFKGKYVLSWKDSGGNVRRKYAYVK